MAHPNIIAYLDKLAVRKPWRTALYGVLVIASASALAVLFGNAADRIGFVRAFDLWAYRTIHLGPHPPWLDTLATPFNFNFLPWGGTFIPSFVYFILALAFLYLIFARPKDIGWTIIAVLIAVLIDTLLYRVTSTYVTRARPFLSLPNAVSDTAKGIWDGWPTFPSGHARDAAIYSTAVSGYGPKLFWPLFIFTVWVAYTRLYLGAHYPSDIIAGLLLGYASGTGVLMIVKSLRRIVEKNPLMV
jgi:undecaprenyl-diphosphatase